MGLVRLLTLLLIVWLIYALVKRYLSKTGSAKRNEQKSGSNDIEKIVRCDKCSVHIPLKEAIEHKGRYYCSKEHLQTHDDA